MKNITVKAIEELKTAINNYMAWEQMFEKICTTDLPDKDSISDSIREKADDFCDEVADLIWDIFTDRYDLTDAQHHDYDRFDEEYEKLENEAGTIKYIASTDESDVRFLNPMPIVFLNELKEELGDIMEIDEEDNVVRFYC